MYLAQVIESGLYWLYSPRKAACTTSSEIKGAFEAFIEKTFIPNPIYRKPVSHRVTNYTDDGFIIYEVADDGTKYKDAHILVEFPDHFTYTDFQKAYPEFFI